MKERPILFNSEMIRAIFEGRKTQTRRIINKKILDQLKPNPQIGVLEADVIVPFGKIGDRLWVRETFGRTEPHPCSLDEDKLPFAEFIDKGNDVLRKYWKRRIAFKADGTDIRPYKWRPSIHMPRWASRITLEITSVRVERLNSIPGQDTFAEGIYKNEWGYDWKTISGKDKVLGSPQMAFANLWIDTGGDWYSNPWVWVIEFKVVNQ